MTVICVNADFDEVLRGSPGKPSLNATIEFLAFWVQNEPVLAHRSYSKDYLLYLEQQTGMLPRPVFKGTSSNWWGDLTDRPLMNKLNSKIWARQWWQQHYRLDGSIVFNEIDALQALDKQEVSLIRRDHGMSGRGHWKTTRGQWEETRQRLQAWFQEGVIIEPCYQRVGDLSALWLPDEQRYIFYRNTIDERFQWKGAEMVNGGVADWSVEEKKLLGSWPDTLVALAQEIKLMGYTGIFSVDAFIYKHHGQLAFMPCSEINARRTMGWITYTLWLKNRPSKGRLMISQEQAGLVLSPPDSPFRWVWSEAMI